MTEALTITTMGMSIVFLVLAVIYVSIVMLNWLEVKYPSTVPVVSKPAVSAPVAGGLITPEEEAAVHAALAHHLNCAPETIQVRMLPESKEI